MKRFLHDACLFLVWFVLGFLWGRRIESPRHAVDASCVATGTCVKLGNGDNFELLPTRCTWAHVASRQLDGGVETLAYCAPLPEAHAPSPPPKLQLVCSARVVSPTAVEFTVDPPVEADVVWRCEDGMQSETGRVLVGAGFGAAINLHLFGPAYPEPRCACNAIPREEPK